jgi:hypothetical protein
MVSQYFTSFTVLHTKSLPSDDGREVKLGVTVDNGLDATLKVHCPSLVQPADGH